MKFWKIVCTFITLLVTMAAFSSTALAYNVSGTVNYGGSKSGRIYLYLEGSNGLGTSVASAGSAFTIRGVPDGSYTLYAFMDTVGIGMRHAADPRGMLGSITVAGANLTSQNITLSDPSAVSPVPPPWLEAYPADIGAFIQWDAPEDEDGVKIADSYNVYWSTSSSFTPGTALGSKTGIPAGDNDFCIAGGLANGTAYYFLITSTTGSTTSAASSIYGPVTIGVPAGGYTVSVPVTLSGFTPTGPLYLAITDDAGKMFFRKITSPTSQTYTVSGVQNGTYFVYSFIDMNNNGIIDTGDVRPGDDGPVITVSGGPVTSPALTLSAGSANAVVQTQHFMDGSYEGYTLNFNVEGMQKQPVSVTLTGGTAAITYPVDIALSQYGDFGLWVQTSRPSTGDTYTFTIYYSDGTSVTNAQASVTGVLDTFPIPLSPLGATGGPGSDTPTFSWNHPSPLPSGTYTYNLWLSSENSMNMWYVDSMPSSQTQVAYNFNGEASQPSLSVGTQYRWGISVQDGYGNKADAQSSFTVTSGITFSGTVVDSGGYPVIGATVALDGYPSVSTVTGTGGTFSLSGLPVGTNFVLKASKTGYVPAYSQVLNSTTDISGTSPFRLFTQGELTSWGVTTGKGAIAATVLDSANPYTGYIGGAVVTATNQASNPYTVTYFDGSSFGGSSTYSNGLAFVINASDGDTATLHASKSGWSFTDAVLPIHANSVSEALLFGTYLQKTLSATITGDGSGSVYSSPSGISCSSGTCSGNFDTGSTVTLTAAPGSGSLFGGWSGDCTNTSGDCTVTMDSDKSVTALFNTYPPVYIEGGNYFDTLQSAFDSKTSSAFIVKAQDVELTGNLSARNSNTVTLKGGYDSIFNQKISGGYTTLKGILTLVSGSLTVEDLVIK